MTWDEDVARLIQATWQLGESFALDQVYRFVPQLSDSHPSNHHVNEKIRQSLQHLRDAGLLEFLESHGTYQRSIPGTSFLPGGPPITVEQVHQRLRVIAQARGLASYSAIYRDRYQARARASRELGGIALQEHHAGRPLLSVVAVRKGKAQPSSGLFQLALDHDSNKTPCGCGSALILAGEDEPAFIARQLALVYAEWCPATTKLGRPFMDLPDVTNPRGTKILAFDLDLLESGSKAHNRLQNLLAAFLRDHGADPSRPEQGEPQYDMAWSTSGQEWMAEVKTLRGTNETQQLRLGLGQLIHYRTQVTLAGKRPRAALVIDRPPLDLLWIEVCRSVGVTLGWPGRFDVLLT